MKYFKVLILSFLCFLGFNMHVYAQVKAKTQAPIHPTTGFFSYYSQKDIIVGMNNPSVLANYVVYHSDGTNIRGFYGWAAQGMQDVFFVGSKSGNTITGKSYDFGDKSENNFKMVISGNFVIVESPMGMAKVPAKKKDFFLDKELTIYESPDKNARVIAKDFNLQNKGFKLIEIGEMDKLDEGEYARFDLWYKIKNNTTEGWVFGLLSVF